MITEQKLEEVKAFLRELAVHKTGKYKGRLYGICYIVAMECKVTYNRQVWESFLYPKWEHYSGSPTFPIPYKRDTTSDMPNTLQAGIAFYEKPLWDKRTHYGKLRREFCLWLADNITIDCFC